MRGRVKSKVQLLLQVPRQLGNLEKGRKLDPIIRILWLMVLTQTEIADNFVQICNDCRFVK